METRVYKTLAKIVGIILLLAGIGAFIGGRFADTFIAEQLGDQHITMPTEEGINGQLEGGRLTQEDADELLKYAGQDMTNGNQAKAFADHYIKAHMRAGAEAAGYPDANYSSLGDVVSEKEAAATAEIQAANPNADEETLAAMVAAEIANPATKYVSAKEAAAITDLREATFLNGNTLRGMLLNAYGWGLVGTIAKYAGIALAIVGLLLGIFGFVPAKKKTAA